MLLLRHIAQENNKDISQKHTEWKLSNSKIEIGDVNKNGKVDIGDIIILLRYIAAKNSEKTMN